MPNNWFSCDYLSVCNILINDFNKFFMFRIHRGLEKRARKIDPTKIANEAENYLFGHSLYKLNGIAGLINSKRIKASIKKIDALEREIIRMEDKIDVLMEKRAIEAAKLEQDLLNNKEILQNYLEPEEFKNF